MQLGIMLTRFPEYVALLVVGERGTHLRPAETIFLLSFDRVPKVDFLRVAHRVGFCSPIPFRYVATAGTFGVGSSGSNGYPFTGVCEVYSLECANTPDDSDQCGDVPSGSTAFTNVEITVGQT